MEEDYSEYYSYPQRAKPVFNMGEVTKWLIIICAIVYLVIPGDLYEVLMYNSDFVFERPWTLITNAFLHGDLFHLLFNCFSLFLFGSLIELRHGSKFYTILFISSVVIANLLFGVFNPGIYGLGISGFVFALIGAAVVLEPRARVIFPIGFFFTTAPVSIAGPIMFLGEVISSIASTDGVGHVAHAAGFLVGIALAFAKKKRTPPIYRTYVRY